MISYEIFILASSRTYKVPSEIIKAVIAQESSGNPKAYRAEPKLKDASRGLMQVLYATAQQLGYKGTPEGLFDPETNIDLGTKYLAYQYKRYGDWDDAFAAYNAGSARKRADGLYFNQDYVDGVKAKLGGILKSLYGYTKQAQSNRAMKAILQEQPLQGSLLTEKDLKKFLPFIVIGIILWTLF